MHWWWPPSPLTSRLRLTQQKQTHMMNGSLFSHWESWCWWWCNVAHPSMHRRPSCPLAHRCANILIYFLLIFKTTSPRAYTVIVHLASSSFASSGAMVSAPLVSDRVPSWSIHTCCLTTAALINVWWWRESRSFLKFKRWRHGFSKITEAEDSARSIWAWTLAWRYHL